jgi:hypothetical protein
MEEEYERIQNLFYPKLVFFSKETVNTDLKGNEVKLVEFVKEVSTEEKIVCECGGTYSHFNKNRHLKTQKHLQFLEALSLVIPNP